jgi:hypothetical protein
VKFSKTTGRLEKNQCNLQAVIVLRIATYANLIPKQTKQPFFKGNNAKINFFLEPHSF